MLTLYRSFLYLYPSGYRREYGNEMICVFRDALRDASTQRFDARVSFRVREIWGLLAGAAQEHAHRINGSYSLFSFTRFNMRPQFRFPKSTVVLMSLILAAVLVAMEKAKSIQIKYAGEAGPSLPGMLVLILLCTFATGVVVWGVLFALRRTGSHRLANIQPWPTKAE